MITCSKCAKENQDHYKFCLGCGAELPRTSGPKKFAQGTPPQGIPVQPRGAPAMIEDEPTHMGTGAPPPKPVAVAPAPAPRPERVAAPAVPAPVVAAVPFAAQPPAPAMVPPAMVAAPPMVPAPAPAAAPAVVAAAADAGISPCPQCSHPNPASNKFCASCGFKLVKPAPAPEPAPAPAPAPAATAVVLTALRADGSESGTYALPSGTVTVGRDTGTIFSGDSYLSPRHATFIPRAGKLFVRDESSLNGVYRKLRREEPVPLNHTNVFRIGQEIIRYEQISPLPPTSDGVERMGSPAKGYIGRIGLIIGRDTSGNAYPVPEIGLHLGRERGDVLFPEDGYVSGLHCRISFEKGQAYLTDLGSSNGTFIRLTSEVDLQNGEILLMGQQLFRVNF